MGNYILSEKKKEENCAYLFSKLNKCIIACENQKESHGAIHLSFPHSGVGVLNCKKYSSYNDFVKNTGKTIDMDQKGNTIENRQLLEYSIYPSNCKVVLDDEAFFYFSSC